MSNDPFDLPVINIPPVEIKCGDLIFFHSQHWYNNFLQWRFKSHWSHAAIAYSQFQNFGMTRKGLVIKDNGLALQQDIQVVRFNLDDHERENMRQELLDTFLMSGKLKFDNWSLINLDHRPKKDHYWCTTFIDKCYANIGFGINTMQLMQNNFTDHDIYDPKVVYDYRS